MGAWPDRALPIVGDDNEGRPAAEVVVVATPWEGALGTVQPLRGRLEGKVVISMVNALVRRGPEIQAVHLARGSIAGDGAGRAARGPGGRGLPPPAGRGPRRPGRGPEADVLVCSDHPEAKEATMALVDSIEGLRPLDAGRLAQAAAIEAFTAVLIGVNIRYKAPDATCGIGRAV